MRWGVAAAALIAVGFAVDVRCQDSAELYQAAKRSYEELATSALDGQRRASTLAEGKANPWVWHFLGEALAEARDLRGAEGAYRRASELDPEQAFHHVAAARIAAMRLDAAAAAARYRHAAKLEARDDARREFSRSAAEFEAYADALSKSRTRIGLALGLAVLMFAAAGWIGRRE